jgi:hypothetical protein
MKTRPLRSLAVLAAAASFIPVNGSQPRAPLPHPESAAVASHVARAADNQWTNDPGSRFDWQLPASSIDYLDTGQPMYQEVHPLGVDALDAWQQTTGGGVIVAVVDTGFDLSQLDLQGQWWVNRGETAANGVDDDHDGLVDDVNGWNFYDSSSDVSGADSHGTSVAAVIAGQANNGIGGAGVAPGARVMALRAGDATGYIHFPGAIHAIEYAVHHGAKVINLSWGSIGEDCSASLKQAVVDADRHGVLMVIAAGNESSNLYDKSYCPDLHAPNEVMVAATDKTNDLAGFSNWGSATVDVAAPGVDIGTLDPTNRWPYSLFDGTSCAAPITAAVAALAYSVRPNATAEMVKQALIEGSTPVAALKDKVVSGGVVNAPNTLRLLEAMPQESLPKPTSTTAPSPPKPRTSTSGTSSSRPGARELAPARVFTLKHAALVHFSWTISGNGPYVLLVDGKKISRLARSSRGRTLHLHAGRHYWLLVPMT